MLYAKQNDLLEQSCQIDAEHTTLDGKIRSNELELGKINQFSQQFYSRSSTILECMEREEAGLTMMDEKLAKLREEDAMLDADLCRNDSTQKASNMTVANDAKCRLEATETKSKQN